MVPISHPVRRSVVTNIAGSVDATLTGNGGTPIAAADIVGGLTTKTIAFAAGETLKYAAWDLVDDALVEGTEGYKVTLSNPQPSGTLSVPSITGTVGDNDTSGGGSGGGAAYGPTSAVDTPFVDLGASGGKLETVLNDTVWVTTLIADADGQPAYRIKPVLNGRITGYYVAADGGENPDGNFNYVAVPAFNGTAARFEQTSDSIRVFIGDMTTPVKVLNRSSSAYGGGGTFVRHQTGGAAVSSTITRN